MPTDERERFWEIINNIRDVDTPLVCMQTQLEELQSAWEKQIPKKPIEIKEMEYGSSFDCPSCGYSLYFDLEHVPDYYCRRCGQKIDWSKE